MATILRCGLLGYESLTTMITEFRKFNCTTHLLLLVAVCCWVVLLGALFRLTSIKLIYGQQNSQLGNNWATNISKKVELGNKKEKEKCTETQQKQALNKQKKVNYFPIHNLQYILSISITNEISPLISPCSIYFDLSYFMECRFHPYHFGPTDSQFFSQPTPLLDRLQNISNYLLTFSL